MNYPENWIPDEELPVRAGLVAIQKNDPNYGLTEDEIQDRIEFIRCYLLKDFALLMMIPKQTHENDFFIHDCDVFDAEYSAFNTHDFQKQMRPFNMQGYAMKKIMERVKDLAIMHSCITQPEIRQLVFERFLSFMAFEFINEVEELARQLHTDISYTEQAQIKRKISTLSRKINKCKRIWERYAPPENWDH
jgi:hypothetical protein